MSGKVKIDWKKYSKRIFGGQEFVVGEEIGQGGFGAVFEGYAIIAGKIDTTKPLAIKYLNKHPGQTQQNLLEGARKEAEIQRMRFPTDVYAGEDDNVVMVMPRFPGESLDKLMRTSKFARLTLSQRLELACVAMQAYAEFHAVYARNGVGLSHTDLKPGNFLIHIYYDEEKDPKHEHPKFECHIIDFANIRIRTPITAAPECVHGEKIGQKAHHVLEMEIHSLVSILAPILGEDVLYENTLNLWDEKCKFTLEHMKTFLRKEGKGNGLVQEIEEVIELIESMQHENPAMRPTDLVIVKTLNRIRIACLRQEQQLEKEEIDDDTKSINAFFSAIKAGHLQEVQEKILNMKLEDDFVFLFNRFGVEGLTPLGVAVKYGQYEVAKYLLQVSKDSRANQKDGYGFNGRSLLHLAILSNRADLVQLLLDNGAEVNQVDADGRTPLHCAISRRCDVALVRQLLDRGASLVVEDAYGRTPLQSAIANACSLEVVQVLIDRENLGKEEAESIRMERLMLAMQSGSVELVRYFYKATDLNLDFGKSRTCLHVAAISGHVDLTKFLIEEDKPNVDEDHNQLIDEMDSNGNTPLHYAAMMGQLDTAKILLEMGADETAENSGAKKFHEIQDPTGRALLHTAVIKGDLEGVKLLISKGADIKAKDERGYTPLRYAISEGHVDVARCLIEGGADINETISGCATLLHLTAEKGWVKIVEIFIDKKFNMNERDNELRTPLHDAILGGHVEVARCLIQNGADINAQDFYGYTPLHLAAAIGQFKSVDFLIGYNTININTPDSYKKTPLHYAIARGHVGVAKHLIDNNADMNAPDRDKNTPLHYAIFGGHVGVAKYLIDNNAGMNAQDLDGNTPLHYAILAGHVEMAKYLIDKGAQLSVKNKENKTPLALAVKEKQFKFACDLIDKGAQIKDATTPYLLHTAAFYNQVELAKQLIAKGADINELGEQGYTPLHVAVGKGNVEMVRFLVGQKGANVSARDEQGNTPLHYAVKKKDLELVRILLRHGAKTDIKNNSNATPLSLCIAQKGSDEMKKLLFCTAQARQANTLDKLYRFFDFESKLKPNRVLLTSRKLAPASPAA